MFKIQRHRELTANDGHFLYKERCKNIREDDHRSRTCLQDGHQSRASSHYGRNANGAKYGGSRGVMSPVHCASCNGISCGVFGLHTVVMFLSPVNFKSRFLSQVKPTVWHPVSHSCTKWAYSWQCDWAPKPFSWAQHIFVQVACNGNSNSWWSIEHFFHV